MTSLLLKQIFILSYLGLFTLSLICGYIYNFHLLEVSLSFFDLILFFKQILLEYIAITFFVLILSNQRKLLKLLMYIIVLLFITIYFSQFVSLAISNDYITKLALHNVEFIGLLLSWENILTLLEAIVFLLLLPFAISLYAAKKLTDISINPKKMSALLLIAFIGVYFVPVNKQVKSFYDKVNLQYASPLQAFYALFTTRTYTQTNFDAYDIKSLKQLGFTYNPTSTYPLLKREIYKKRQSFFKNQKPKNVIVIFTEGFSARTSGIYNKKFNGLTPNLKELADNNETMVVKNYYNHTAATYRGLHGQLCSIYPTLGGADGWEKQPDGIPFIRYKCLPDIFNNNGYDTTYLNIHYKDATGNDELASRTGFKHVISGEELSTSYLQGIHKLRANELTDHQAYKALTNYLKSHEQHSKPFFLTMYTVETHAWLDVIGDGIKYKDGSDNTLNTVHNMDDAFGKFWKYFKNSAYADNTVVVFTSDHCHYYDKDYLKLMKRSHEDDYQKYFVDRIPLLIHTPYGNLPKKLNAQNATSISLAPTIVQLMGFANEPTAFMGQSLFERTTDKGIANIGDSTYLINGKIYDLKTVPLTDKPLLHLADRYIHEVHTLEMNNTLIPASLK